jgi:acyl-CoA reductase-like NAD-dependent aldehyde dehydrogenase
MQFGPVLPIIKYSDDDEALARANKSDLGLGGSVWSKDIATANAMANQIESGTVWVRFLQTRHLRRQLLSIGHPRRVWLSMTALGGWV